MLSAADIEIQTYVRGMEAVLTVVRRNNKHMTPACVSLSATIWARDQTTTDIYRILMLAHCIWNSLLHYGIFPEYSVCGHITQILGVEQLQ